MLAAWLWCMAVTDEPTYFRTGYAHFDWCLCCPSSLFPASSLMWPSSETSTYFCTCFAPKISEKITAVTFSYLDAQASLSWNSWRTTFCFLPLFCPVLMVIKIFLLITWEEELQLVEVLVAGICRPQQMWQRSRRVPLPPVATDLSRDRQGMAFCKTGNWNNASHCCYCAWQWNSWLLFQAFWFQTSESATVHFSAT